LNAPSPRSQGPPMATGRAGCGLTDQPVPTEPLSNRPLHLLTYRALSCPLPRAETRISWLADNQPYIAARFSGSGLYLSTSMDCLTSPHRNTRLRAGPSRTICAPTCPLAALRWRWPIRTSGERRSLAAPARMEHPTPIPIRGRSRLCLACRN